MSGVGAGRGDLVIGIGNPLRGDDGVGWWLAAWVRRQRPTPMVRRVPQLVPELALELAVARRVLFVDAWCAPVGATGWESAGATAAPVLRALQPGGAELGLAGGHALDPGGLLALAGLWVPPPPAWLLLVPAFAFPHGRGLSAALRHQLPAAQALLAAWLADRQEAAPSPSGGGTVGCTS
jgi:hydrogenase maturation protease